MAFVLATDYRDDILNLYKAQFGTSLRLFKLPTSGEPSRTMVYADFTVANFTGYAHQPTAYLASILDGDAAYSFSDTELFQHTSADPDTDNDIYGAIGYYDADELAAAMLASTPQVMDECGDAILLRLKIWLKDSDSGSWMFCNELMKRIVAAFEPYRCRLFQNDYTPTAGDTICQYVECTFPGYVSSVLDWCAAALDGNTAYIESGVVSYTATEDSDPAQLAYGYYLTTSENAYIGAEQFASPIDMSTASDNIAMEVKLNLSNPVA